MNESSLKKCPACGAAFDAEGVSGCPRCLMLAALQPTQHTESGERPPPPSLAAVSAAFPQLEVLELIGQGGMGCVFKARQPQLNRFVALKILPEALSRDAAFATRFTREAQALAALSHPNIVTIHDFGQAGGFFYLLMEFVDGVNLRQALRGGHFTPEQALAIVPPLCDALQFAHERGIVHRDIKPENLLLDKAGRIKVADFGIAKMLAAIGAAACEAPGPDSPSASATGKPPIPSFLTADNATAGTPGYMAPEQKATPQRVDSRADIYSLGVVLYEMLTGELPAEKLQPPSRKVQIDVRLDEIVLRALEQTPELRYQTAAELRTQVVTISEGAAPIPNAGQTEYVSSWGFRLTTGPAIKTGYVRFWEKLFGSVTSAGAINTLNLSRIGFVGCLALFAILPGWRWCWPAFGFLGMFVGIGAAYLSEAAARRGVDLSKTRGLPAEQSQRGVWRRRIVWLAIGGGVLPMAFFAFSLLLSLGRNGEKVIEAATIGQMAVVFAKIFAMGSGLTLLIWALLRTFWRNAANSANPWLRHPEALVALTMLWPLLLIAAPFVIWSFVSAHRPPRDPMNAAEWITWGLVVFFSLQGAIWFTRKLRETMREANDSCADPGPKVRSQAAGEWRAQEETAVFTTGSSRSKVPPTKIGTWSGWGIVGTAVGLTSWIVLTAILSGWSGAGVALSQATVGIILVAALVLWNVRHRITQFCGQMWLIAVGLLATALFLFGAHWLGLSMIASWPGGAMVSPLKLAWALWIFPLVALRLWIRNRLAPAVTPTPEPPMPPSRQLVRSLPVRKWWHKALVTVLLAFAIAIPLRAWVLQAFVIPVKSLEPELPAGSRVLVWKITRQFAPGDIVAHKHGDRVWVSRVVREEQEQLILQRNQWPEEKLPRADVIGKVVSVLWRPTPGADAPKVRGVLDSSERATEPLALFAPVIDPSVGDLSYRLVSTLVKPRQVVVAEVALVDDRYSTAHTISQLGFYHASADGTTNASARVTWSVEKVTEGEGAWIVRTGGEGGGSKFERIARLGSRNKGFADILVTPAQPAQPENPDRGAETSLDDATTTWVAVRPERSHWVGPGEWNVGEWNSLTLFEARDDKGKVQRRLRLKLLVCPMLPDAKVPWRGTLLRNGDWGKDQTLRDLIGGPLAFLPKAETPQVVPDPKPAPRGEVHKAGIPAETAKPTANAKPPD